MKKYFQAPWTPTDLAIVIGSILVLGIFNYGIFNYFIDLNGIKEANKVLYILILLTTQWIIFFTPLILITWRKYKLNWSQFGFVKISFLKTIGLIFVGYFLYMIVNFIINLIIIYANVKIPGYQIQESIFNIIGNDKISIIIGGFIVMVIAPLLEELFFRGFLLRALANKVGDSLGSIITAMAFALLHFPWQSFIPIFILGIILNGLVIRSKSIWPAIGFHFLNNSIAFTLLLLIEKKILSIETLAIIH